MSSARLRARNAVLVVALGALSFGLLVSTSRAPYVPKAEGPESIAYNPVYNALRPTPPTPFYTPPDPLPIGLPGTIIKSEPMPEAPPGIRATRIMYLSTSTTGQPIAVTGMIAEPDAPTGPAGRPVVAFAHGTTGTARPCAPSIAPFTDQTVGTHMWEARMRPLVNQGYVVAAADYEGEGAPGDPVYMLKAAEAHNVLDSLRAAVYLAPDRIDAARMAIYGHSQGGHASLSAASLAPEYAPELQLRGAVVSAPGMIPPIPLALAEMASNPGNEKEAAIRASYMLNLASSWTTAFPDELSPSDLLTPEGVEAMNLAKSLCHDALVKQMTKPFASYVKPNPSLRVLNVVAQNMPVDRRVEMPILMLQGMADTDVSPQLTVAATQALCQHGSVVDTYFTESDPHETLVWTARPAELDWIADRFAGKPAPNTCTGQQ
ncbi:MAG TPA: alpha/beta fold hydrolase [Mycobacterium sp.]|nr:alpha/beta fold hydrolase [Mycobacterium sp.]